MDNLNLMKLKQFCMAYNAIIWTKQQDREGEMLFINYTSDKNNYSLNYIKYWKNEHQKKKYRQWREFSITWNTSDWEIHKISIFLTIKECILKLLRFNFTVRLAKIYETNFGSWGQEHRRGTLIHCWWKYKLVQYYGKLCGNFSER